MKDKTTVELLKMYSNILTVLNERKVCYIQCSSKWVYIALYRRVYKR